MTVLKGRSVWLIAIFLASCDGNSGRPSVEMPTQPTSSTTALAKIAVEPRAVNGGAPSTVKITLNAPASEPTPITLTSNSQTIAMPPSVTVAAGSSSASVAVSTSFVSSDTTVLITASLGGTSMQSSLAVWSIQPTSFSYDAVPTDRGGYDGVGRYTADSTVYFRAECDSNGVYVEFSSHLGKNRFDPGGRWEVTFSPSKGTPLGPGTYEVPPGLITEQGQTLLRINGPPYVCSTGKAQIVIGTFEYRTTGEIERFVATVEQQQCVAGVFRAEIRLTRPPLLGSSRPFPGKCMP